MKSHDQGRATTKEEPRPKERDDRRGQGTGGLRDQDVAVYSWGAVVVSEKVHFAISEIYRPVLVEAKTPMIPGWH